MRRQRMQNQPSFWAKNRLFWVGSGGKCNPLEPLLPRWSLRRDRYEMTSRGTKIFVHYVLMSIAKTPIRPTPISDNDSTLEKRSGVHNYDSLLPRNMSVDRNEPKYGSFLLQSYQRHPWHLVISFYSTFRLNGIAYILRTSLGAEKEILNYNL